LGGAKLSTHNLDERTVRSFGAEWAHFDQSPLAHEAKIERRFNKCFGIFPWNTLPDNPVGPKVGRGSGRWAALVAPRRNLTRAGNCTFRHASVDVMPIPAGSLDFRYYLGVWHHIPDTSAGIRSCVQLLKPGAPFLLYLHHALGWSPDMVSRYLAGHRFRAMDHRAVAAQSKERHVTDMIALSVYLQLARFAALIEYFGGNRANLPLS
jgi:SAM-dependent methyltransferase